MATHDELKEAIRTYAYKSASETLIIGPDEERRDAWLFDFRALLLQPTWLNTYAELFWAQYQHKYPFQVCGMETAAISLVAAIVMKGVERGTPVNGLFVRKSRKRTGLLKQIEGTPTNEPVILVDDLINTGGTFKKQLAVLQDANLSVIDIFVMLSFKEPRTYQDFTAKNIEVYSVFSLKDFNAAFLPSPDLSQEMEPLWKFSAPNPSYNIVVQKSAPVIDGEKIYFGSDAGIFYALEQTTGEVAWTHNIGKFPDGKGILSSPALYNNIIYFGAYDGNVYALNTDTGTQQWVYSEADWVGSSPAIASEHNLLLIGLEFGLWGKRGGIVALDLSTGNVMWQHRTPALTHGSPLYIPQEDMVVIGSNDAVLYAYEARTGKELWQYGTVGEVKSSPTYDAESRLIFFGTLGGRMYAVSPQGTPIYSKEIGPVYSTPKVQNSTVYVASLDKTIYAFEASTGQKKWERQTNGRIFASPLMIGNSLWIGSNDGRLYEIDIQNGKIKKFFQTSERIVNKIAYNTSKGMLFLPTQANEIYCLKNI